MTSLTPTATANSVTASWTVTDDCALISGFIVSYNGVAELPVSANTYTDTKTGLNACQGVTVAVYATFSTSSTTTPLSQSITTLSAGESFGP